MKCSECPRKDSCQVKGLVESLDECNDKSEFCEDPSSDDIRNHTPLSEEILGFKKAFKGTEPCLATTMKWICKGGRVWVGVITWKMDEIVLIAPAALVETEEDAAEVVKQKIHEANEAYKKRGQGTSADLQEFMNKYLKGEGEGNLGLSEN